MNRQARAADPYGIVVGLMKAGQGPRRRYRTSNPREVHIEIDLTRMPKLGFGLMRLPEKDGAIDLEQVCRMADAYLDAGLNYFDTAYVYHGGNSERIVREALVRRHPRGSFTVATKLPAWCMREEADRDRIFKEQMKRCGVDYFDFYLYHVTSSLTVLMALLVILVDPFYGPLHVVSSSSKLGYFKASGYKSLATTGFL